MIRMAKKKKFPSRDLVAYIGIPKVLYKVLQDVAKEEDRSVSWMARKAIRTFLEGQKRWPPASET